MTVNMERRTRECVLKPAVTTYASCVGGGLYVGKKGHRLGLIGTLKLSPSLTCVMVKLHHLLILFLHEEDMKTLGQG